MAQKFEHRKVGEILVQSGTLSQAEVEIILRRMKETGRRFGKTGEEEGFFSDEVTARALSEQFMLEYVDLDGYTPEPELLSCLPPDFSLRYNLLPLQRRPDALVVATADPTDILARESAELLLDTKVVLRVAARSKLSKILELGAGSKRVLEEASEDFKLQLIKETDKGEEVLSLDKLTSDTSPIVRLVDSTLFDALKTRASDIHVESSLSGVSIKYRVDGVLFQVTSVDAQFMGPIISRIKVMSELDISEHRIPQDGRFKVRMGDKSIDFRVSVLPTSHGEDAVIRILDKEAVSADFKGLSLEALGFPEREKVEFRRLIREPYGMVLVTGPTGSGKTTTLYAALCEINSVEEKLITIEDPVEYQLPGVVQVPVNEKKGLSFAAGLRSILRHDPDKIMVGEIRDPETAQIAVQSALTGHLVFTTVHANSVFDVLGRFLHMGIDPYNFASCLNCVVAQRLVRKICPHCKKEVRYDARRLSESGLHFEEYAEQAFFEGQGCVECRGTGYQGRSAIVELLRLDDTMRELILTKAPISQLKKVAFESGTRSLRESAIEKVLAGVTSLREIDRITFAERGGS